VGRMEKMAHSAALYCVDCIWHDSGN